MVAGFALLVMPVIAAGMVEKALSTFSFLTQEADCSDFRDYSLALNVF